MSEDFPPGGQYQIEYGDIPLAPLISMNDIHNIIQEIEEAKETNRKMNIILKKIVLCLNIEKSIERQCMQYDLKYTALS